MSNVNIGAKAIRVDDIMDALKAGQRGAFKFYHDGLPPHGSRNGLHFVCPGCGEIGGINFNDPGGWYWDGNCEAPTCTPSILHDVRSCGWHGYLTAGEFRPC